eukprot:CAMPEP_0117435806 /NCGR_PEP_ID=MMETSP0759-20121206/675_1 /TAXON_ID=63605 /ORGANISM="Percolomonas cosmopolitus, Strain WS" /LENGTH=2580 /DNA_ID=CAMNT_0005227373 /DNA_START=333 /DNA_END=8074 /DNA_ORIENTATION=+
MDYIGIGAFVVLADFLIVILSAFGLYSDDGDATQGIFHHLGFLNLLDSQDLGKGIFLLVALCVVFLIALIVLVFEIVAWRLKVSFWSSRASDVKKKDSDPLLGPNREQSGAVTRRLSRRSAARQVPQPSATLADIEQLNANHRQSSKSTHTPPGDEIGETEREDPLTVATSRRPTRYEYDSIVPLNVTSQKPRHLGRVRKVTLLVFFMLTATVFPSIIASIFLLAFIIVLILYMLKGRRRTSPPTGDTTTNILSRRLSLKKNSSTDASAHWYDRFLIIALALGVIYSLTVCVALYVSKMWFTESVREDFVWQLFGFVHVASFSPSWNVVFFYIFLVINLFLMSQAIICYYFSKEKTNTATGSVMEIVAYGRVWFTEAFVDSLIAVSFNLLLLCFAVITIVAPSLLSIVWLGFLFIGIFLSANHFRWLMPLALFFGIIFMVPHYVFSMPRIRDFIPSDAYLVLYKVGLRPENDLRGLVFVCYGVLLILILLFWRSKKLRKEVKHHTAQEANTPLLDPSFVQNTNYSSMAAVEHFPNEAALAARKQAEQMDSPNDEVFNVPPALETDAMSIDLEDLPFMDAATNTTPTIAGPTNQDYLPLVAGQELTVRKRTAHFTKSLWRRTKHLIEIVLHVITRNSFYLCLLFIYFVGLTFLRPNLMHAVYLIFFIVFFAFPVLAHRLWVLLVLYTMFVILALYSYNAYFYDYPEGEADNILRLIGFYPFHDDYPTYHTVFTELIWHYLILMFAGITYAVIRLRNFGGLSIQKWNSDKVLPETLKNVGTLLVIGFAKVAFVITFITLILIILLHNHVSIFILGFTILLFLCLMLSVVLTRLLPVAWIILMTYTAVVLALLYFYQFPYIHDLVDRFNDIDEASRWYISTETIGFQEYSVASLGLLPYALLLILTLFQLKYTRRVTGAKRKINASLEDTASKDLSPIVAYVVFKIKIFFMRLCILHHPKLLLIFLFIAAQLNATIIGLFYLGVVLVLSPVPFLITYIWLLLVFFSEVIILLEMIYQLPYFQITLQCGSLDPSSACVWLRWVGLDAARGRLIGAVLWELFLVLISAHFQRVCLTWRRSLQKKGLHTPGRLFAKEDPNVKKPDTTFYFYYFLVKKRLIFVFNHFFDTFGYEISMLTLLVGVLLMIQTVWGLLFLILFGILLFVGRRRLYHAIWLWILVVLAVEAVILILYIFSLRPFPPYDYTENLNARIFNYIKLRTFNDDEGPWYIVIHYIILFFMAQQTRVFWKNRGYKDHVTSELLEEAQTKTGQMKVWLSPPKDRVDFTLYQHKHTIYYFVKFLIYHYTISLVLIVIFIDSAIRPSLIKLLEIALVIVFTNGSMLSFGGPKRFGCGSLGVFYFFILFLETLFQIPIVLYGDIETWRIGSFGRNALQVIGFKELDHFGTYFIDILVIALYYFQERLFDSKGYIFYTNYVFRQSRARIFKFTLNRAFRSGRLLKVFARQLYDDHRRKTNLQALKKYQEICRAHSVTDQKVLYDLYTTIYLKSVQSSENKQFKRPVKRAIEYVNGNPEFQHKILDRIDRYFMETLLSQAARESQRVKRPDMMDGVVQADIEGDIAFSDQEKEDILENVHISVDDLYNEERPAFIPEFEPSRDGAQPGEPKPSNKKEAAIGFGTKIANYVFLLIRWFDKSLQRFVRICPFDDTNLNAAITRVEERKQRALTLEVVNDYQSSDEDEIFIEGIHEHEHAANHQNPHPLPRRYHKHHKHPHHFLEHGADVAHKRKNMDINAELPQEEEISIDPHKDDDLRTSDSVSQDMEADAKPHVETFSEKMNDIRRQVWHLTHTTKLLYFSFTDVLCYTLMIINFVVNPSFLSLLYTMVALGWAAIQFPYPSKTYWYLTIAYSVFLIILQYIFYLVQALFDSDALTSDTYTWWELFGWRPRRSLVSDIIVNILIIMAVVHHKNILKDRGDWGNVSAIIREQKDAANQEFMQMVAEKSENKDEEDEPILANIEDLEDDALSEEEEEVENARATEEEATGFSKITAFVSRIKTQFTFKLARVVNPNSKIGRDFYAFQTFVQLFLIIAILLSFPAMSGRQGDQITQITSSNNINIILVISLFAVFIIICIDRVIYLFHSVKAKLIFQLMLLVGAHVLFIVAHAQMQQVSNSTGLAALRITAFLGFVYLLISCFQIQSGYPAYTYKEFLMKDGLIYYLAFTVYRAIPFLFEMKTLIDWTFTPTTFNYYNWMKLEDIRATLFVRKYINSSKRSSGRQTGETTSLITKLFAGFLLFVLLSLILFFPLFFFSNVNPALQYNWVNEVELEITVAGWTPMYVNTFRVLNPESKAIEWSQYAGKYATDRDFRDFEEFEKIQAITLSPFSDIYWQISAPSRRELMEALRTNDPQIGDGNLGLSFAYTFRRIGPPSQREVQRIISISLTESQQTLLRQMIDPDTPAARLDISVPYNPFIINLQDGIRDTSLGQEYWPNCTLSINSGLATFAQLTEYFTFECVQFNLDQDLVVDGPAFYIQSTRIVGEEGLFSFLSGIGILAFYTTFVLTVGRFLRMYVSGLVEKIPFEDVDNVNVLWSFIGDIYIARGSGDLELEERLYREALKIFRLPVVLHLW